MTIVAIAPDASERMAAAIDRAFRLRQRAWEMPVEHRETEVIGPNEARARRTALRAFNRMATEAHTAAAEAGLAAGLGELPMRLRELQEIAENEAFLDMHIESEESQTAWTTYGEVAHWVSDGLWEGLENAFEHACEPPPAEVRCRWARYRAMDVIGSLVAERRRLSEPSAVDPWLVRLGAAFRRNAQAGMTAWEDGAQASELEHSEALRAAVEATGPACAE